MGRAGSKPRRDYLLQSFLRDHNCSQVAETRVKQFLKDYHTKHGLDGKDCQTVDEALESLPKDLQMLLRREERVPVLSHLPFYHSLSGSEPAIQISDRAAKTRTWCKNDFVFTPDTKCEFVYIVMRDGLFKYLNPVNKQDVIVLPPNLVCEASLWLLWEHRGSLQALTHSSAMTLDVLEFVEVLRQHPEALMSACCYAEKFIELLEHHGCRLDIFNKAIGGSDFIPPTATGYSLMEYPIQHCHISESAWPICLSSEPAWPRLASCVELVRISVREIKGKLHIECSLLNGSMISRSTEESGRLLKDWFPSMCRELETECGGKRATLLLSTGVVVNEIVRLNPTGAISLLLQKEV